jgi:hypothetical protein
MLFGKKTKTNVFNVASGNKLDGLGQMGKGGSAKYGKGGSKLLKNLPKGKFNK